LYVKLFASILDSSIWSEDYPTRLVWITLLAMADAEGIVKASVSGVARRAAVTRAEAEAAVQTLLSPDKDRPDQPHDGRRLELVDGGWRVLNYEKYREIRTQQQLRDAMRQRKHREASRSSRDTSQQAEAVSEAYSEALKAEEEQRLGVGYQEIGDPAKGNGSLRGYLRASRSAAATAAVVRSFGPGGTDGRYSWTQIDRALTEMAAASVPFTSRALAGFLRKIQESPNGREEPSQVFARMAREARQG
jgi:hypothetical protein